MASTAYQTGSVEELGTLIDGFKSATLFTRGADGQYRGRPMGVQRREPDQSIWFATLLDTEKVRDLNADPQCAVYFQDGESSPTWVSMSGRAGVIQDRAKIRELWNPSMALWFPDGPDQADLTLIHFHPQHVEYMNVRGGKLSALLMAVKLYAFKDKIPQAEKRQLELR